MAAGPLVSCIMPTRDRRAFVPLALDCFLRQDYPERELVIVDDGRDAVRDLVPPDPRIRYERLERPLVLGAKRNLACRLARGDLIAHWDDDDWSAPGRLSAHVAALAAGEADVSGLDELLFFDPAAERAWLYSYPRRSSRPWVAGGTLCYRRSFWQAHPFPEIGVGEDTRFVWAKRARVAALGDRSLYVATVHRANTSTKRPRSPRWRPVERAEVTAVLGAQEPALRSAATGESPAEPHVLVSIPYFRCRAHIRQCVESVLAQTHRNLTAVVVNDGDAEPPWDLLADLDDSRLVRFDLPRNRGRYFADEVVLRATTSGYVLVHDADDWSEPHRIATLLRRLRAEHAVGAVSAARRRSRLVDVSRLQQPPGERLEHLANLHGLFRTDALRAVGGFYAGFTVGYDTFLVNALAMTGRIAALSEPLYHWRVRPDSLTSARETGLRSELRQTTARHLREMYRHAHRSYTAYLDGSLDADALAAAIRGLGAARVPARHGDELAEQSRRLAGVLAGAAAGATPPPPAVRPRRAVRAVPARPRRRVADVYGLLTAPGIAWDAWAISRAVAVELAERLERRRPGRILELGSGVSTAVLAQYALRASAQVVTLEHHPAYAARTRRLLASLGLDGGVDLRLARLRPLACGDGKSRPWYGAELEGRFDFVLLDGPPAAVGRAAALFALEGRLADDWELWLDDANREHEQDCLRLWARHVRPAAALHDVGEKGLAVLGPADARVSAGSPAGLGIGVLTGGRPDLLRRTVESLVAQAPAALESARVHVLVNAGDRETEDYVRGLPFVDRVVVSPRRLSVGTATSRLLTELAETRGVRTVLHLEDDWAVSTLADGWLERGVEVLRTAADVGQVRLRHRSERVLGHHMVTRRQIAWAADGDVLRSPSAHFTFNPSLVRARDVRRVFPAATELDAQRRFLRARLASVQLSPGVFRHIGERRSLRA